MPLRGIVLALVYLCGSGIFLSRKPAFCPHAIRLKWQPLFVPRLAIFISSARYGVSLAVNFLSSLFFASARTIIVMCRCGVHFMFCLVKSILRVIDASKELSLCYLSKVYLNFCLHIKKSGR